MKNGWPRLGGVRAGHSPKRELVPPIKHTKSVIEEDSITHDAARNIEPKGWRTRHPEFNYGSWTTCPKIGTD
jgi:hypothetical protein